MKYTPMLKYQSATILLKKSLLLPIIPAISTWQFTYFHIIFILVFLILYKKTNIFAEKRRNYVFWF